MLETIQTINTDVLVIGGGGAGLRAAIEARKYDLDVLLASKSLVGYANNSAISRGVFAAVGVWKGSEDSPEEHSKDTIISGRLINDPKMVAVMTRGATQQVYDLIKFGVILQKQDGDLWIEHQPGHTYPRHIAGERRRGISISRPLRQYAASIGVRFKEDILITRLLKSGNMVMGALGIDSKGQLFIFNAKSTILATGGAGDLYLKSDNASGSTGDGYALAYDVGASLRDMEFVQFYPTALHKNGQKLWSYGLLMGLLRKKEAIIRNSLGEDVLERYGVKELKLMTRDIMTRTMMSEIAEGKGINSGLVVEFTSLAEEEFKKMPSGLALGAGYSKELWVTPTAHFFMGGVKIKENCETEFNGLYAAGEVCSGVHGANRLAGNAITEMLVFGMLAGDNAAARASKMAAVSAPQNEVLAGVERLKELASQQGKESLGELQQSLRQTMWDKVGIIRNKEGLEAALREVLSLRKQLKGVSSRQQLSQAIKLSNMLTVSEMVCRAALARTESRGAHYRTDYPFENEQWLKNIEISSESGNMTLQTTPVVM